MDGAWRLLLTYGLAPGYNMALDEALLLSVDTAPTLRLYTWEPPALSLGYFQRWADLAHLAEGRTVVRRLTGGGAIHHADELTFSIAADEGTPLYRGEVRRSYERIHGVLAATLARAAGVGADLRGASHVLSDIEQSPMCFHRSTDLDLVWDGAKGIGSAQRRSGGRVLHHGSIKIGSTELEGPVATLRTYRPDLTPEHLGEVLCDTFQAETGIVLEPGEATAQELAHAQERASFFESEAFVQERRDPSRKGRRSSAEPREP